MKNATDLLFVFSKSREKQTLQRQAAWKFVFAVTFFLVGAYCCLYGPGIIGIPVVALGGFFGGLGVSRLREAASIDDVFRG